MSLFGFIGKIAKGALGIATGGASNALLGAGQAILGGAKARQTVGTALALPTGATPTFRLPDSTVTRSGVSVGGLTIGSRSTTYYGPGTNNGRFVACQTKDGRPRKKRKDGKCYKRPAMNPVNPRALKRAVRRVHAFQEIARAVGFSRPPKLMKGVGFPKKRRAPRCK